MKNNNQKADRLETMRDSAFERLKAAVEGAQREIESAEESNGGSEKHEATMKVLRKQQHFIDCAAAEPRPRAAVLSVQKPSPEKQPVNGEHREEQFSQVVVSYQGMQLDVRAPEDMGVKPGDTVSLLNSTLQPVEVIDEPIPVGEIANIVRVIDDSTSEISFRGEKRVVLNGLFRDELKPEAGDRVVVDSGCLIILRNLGKANSEFQFLGDANVTWDKIIGCGVAKEKLRDAIEEPYERPDILEHYKDEPPKGVLVVGKAGNGKTMLLKASSTSHRKQYGDKSLVLYVAGGELLRGIVGETEELIRQLFAIPRAHFRRTGVRALLIVDEAEAVFKKRGSGKSSDVEDTNVPTFLSEMNGLDSVGNPIVLLATNRPGMLDEAITRDERMDEVILIPPPAKEDAPAFFELYLENVPIECGLQEMAGYATNEFFSSVYALAKVKRKNETVESFTLANIVNGAMLRGVVRRAKWFARKRDSEKTKLGDKLGVVTKEDIRLGIQDALEKNKHLDHQAEFLEFVRGFKDDIAEPDEVLKMISN